MRRVVVVLSTYTTFWGKIVFFTFPSSPLSLLHGLAFTEKPGMGTQTKYKLHPPPKHEVKKSLTIISINFDTDIKSANVFGNFIKLSKTCLSDYLQNRCMQYIGFGSYYVERAITCCLRFLLIDKKIQPAKLD